MYASIGAWLYRYVAGIAVNGLQPILIHPRMAMDRTLLPRVHAEVVTVAGPISVDYERPSEEVLLMSVRLPHNTRATITLEPTIQGARCTSLRDTQHSSPRTSRTFKSKLAAPAAKWLDGVDGVEEVRQTANNDIEVDLLSGQYTFEARWSTQIVQQQ